MITRSEELQEMANIAEDSGKEVWICRYEDTEIIEYIEIDGVEILNEEVRDEVNDSYWEADAYRVAESYIH